MDASKAANEVTTQPTTGATAISFEPLEVGGVPRDESAHLVDQHHRHDVAVLDLLTPNGVAGNERLELVDDRRILDEQVGAHRSGWPALDVSMPSLHLAWHDTVRAQMSLGSVRTRLRETFFLSETEHTDDLGPWPIAVCLAIFVITRSLTLLVFRLRHVPLVMSDSANYVTIARFIQSNGVLPFGPSRFNRQFPGLPFLMVAVDHLFHDLELSGYVVAWGGSIASIALFHAMFRNSRLTTVYTLFVPSWIATSSRIMSEGLTFLLLLLAVRGLRSQNQRTQLMLLLISGYALVVRNAAIAFLFPFVVAWSLANRPVSVPKLLMRLVAVGAASAGYLAYNYATIGILTPQTESTKLFFIEQAGAYYPHDVLTWPGHSLYLGLIRPGGELVQAAFGGRIACARGVGLPRVPGEGEDGRQ